MPSPDIPPPDLPIATAPMTDARSHALPPIRLRLLGTVPYTDALTRMREWTAARQAARKAALAGEALPAAAPAVMPATGEASLRRDWPDLAEAATAGDEIWLMQHPPVFTLGMNSQPEHLLDAGDIPVVPTERGGQITYHGPGQIMAYLMLDLRARRLGIRTLVERIEDALIACLGQYGITAFRQEGAPGIYVLPGQNGPVQPADGAAQWPAGTITPPVSGQHHVHARHARPAAGVAKIASIGLKTSHGFSYHGLALNGQMDLSPFHRINPCGFRNLQMTDIHRQAALSQDLDLDALALALGKALAAAIEG